LRSRTPNATHYHQACEEEKTSSGSEQSLPSTSTRAEVMLQYASYKLKQAFIHIDTRNFMRVNG
jgi:hypothetical protein